MDTNSKSSSNPNETYGSSIWLLINDIVSEKRNVTRLERRKNKDFHAPTFDVNQLYEHLP